ncbi:MAG: hypothetical protein PF569_05565 [Candidatus Woesearchaeota archaeon]|jgi:hypothetical protein|nr:hypothetical protein [Candidatus Woesearchaeota archaeon]
MDFENFEIKKYVLTAVKKEQNSSARMRDNDERERDILYFSLPRTGILKPKVEFRMTLSVGEDYKELGFKIKGEVYCIEDSNSPLSQWAIYDALTGKFLKRVS